MVKQALPAPLELEQVRVACLIGPDAALGAALSSLFDTLVEPMPSKSIPSSPVGFLDSVRVVCVMVSGIKFKTAASTLVVADVAPMLDKVHAGANQIRIGVAGKTSKSLSDERSGEAVRYSKNLIDCDWSRAPSDHFNSAEQSVNSL